ncbi:MAG TPA: arsenic resistance N-acetyltransferase ArsN2 [Gemmatimonadales bacterium]|jgi:amino-acid N-acetyltransferase
MTASIRPATPGDFTGVVSLLHAADLPTAGLQPRLADFLVAEDHGRIVGAIGLEVYGDRALLRSAVVDAGHRNSGLGSDLVARLLERARVRGVREVYLLTTTAERYFPRFGFHPIARSEVAPAVCASEEFRGACPESAVAMRRLLEDT